MYGYRGREDSVDLLTPYEMLLHYSMERILPPTNAQRMSRAVWTEEGKAYREQCREEKSQGYYRPGEHFLARDGEDRILLPDLSALHGLRHCWCWEARSRPHLPTWSFAKVPRPQFSPEENARLLCVYLRPWTLRETESTRYNPLLSLMGKCEIAGEVTTPVWTTLLDPGAAHVPPESSAPTSTPPPSKRRKAIQTQRYP